jgi:hypothetical protein
MTQLACRSLVLAILLSVILLGSEAAQDLPPGRLDQIKVIFVPPMKGRLEHYLTNEIVRWGHFQITLNPHDADAVFSDTTDVSIRDFLEDPPKIRTTRAKTRGTAFLIDVKDEKVLWSGVVKPSEPFFLGGDKSNHQLAQEIVELLKKDMKAK